MSSIVSYLYNSQEVDSIKIRNPSSPIVYRGDLDDADFIAWLREVASAIEGKQRYEVEIKLAKKSLRDKENEQKNAYEFINRFVYLAHEDVELDKGRYKAEINHNKNGMSMDAVLYSNKPIDADDIDKVIQRYVD
ncbi:hypothetical protein J5069_02345 [Candidatus Symbiopectobacterium sp. NZEC127]|uniref:hypothetical protein n=1 Tax=Candidatus Symbiopectobacterium sp. NZEC127 TaxID=2820472 RepID=UPI002227F55F|nr:hypothetical protein [Candidatus Symbiopectobacterium sp. NZEC127]MCW2484729.1 hypothetical protein [Candidatus Symbiopectobacterium sp. NZEC127]